MGEESRHMANEGAAAVRDRVEPPLGVETVFLPDPRDDRRSVPVLVTPKGMAVQAITGYLDGFLDHPKRRAGRSEHATLDSLIAHARRMANRDSVAFMNPLDGHPTMTVVYDYDSRVSDDPDPRPDKDFPKSHRPALVDRTVAETVPANWRSHLAVHRFPLDRRWKDWEARDGDSMDQAEFAAFLEERVMDVIAPPNIAQPAPADKTLNDIAMGMRGGVAGPEGILDLSRGLSIHAESKVMSVVDRATGEGAVTFEGARQGGEGVTLEVPALFHIAIPVFKGGPPYRVLVRLRYRETGAALGWGYRLHRAEDVFDLATHEAVERFGEETGLPVFMGTSET